MRRKILSPLYTTGSFYFTRVTSKALKPEKLEAKLKICVGPTWQGLGGRGLALGATLAVDGIKPPCTNTTTSQT